MKKTSFLFGCFVITVFLLISCTNSSEENQTLTPTLSIFLTETMATDEATPTMNPTVEARLAAIYANRTEAASFTATPKFTKTTAPANTITPTEEAEESGEIKNSLGVDLHNLKNEPGLVGEILEKYPQTQRELETNFPIIINNEVGGGFITLVTDVIFYKDYDTAPSLYGDKLMAELELSYLDVNGKEQLIFIPIEKWDSTTKEDWMFGTSVIYILEESVVRGTMERGSIEFYYRTLSTLTSPLIFAEPPQKVVLKEGAFFDLDAIFPDETLMQNRTGGQDFELLKTDTPPYTETDLEMFRKTGDPQFLPLVNGKRYLWPCASGGASLFNIYEDR